MRYFTCLNHAKLAILNVHVHKKVALRDIAKIEKLQIFVLLENEASYEVFCLPTSVLSHVIDTLCNIFSQNLI